MAVIGAIIAVEAVTRVLSAAPAGMPWWHEGELRAWLRRRLCLTGQSWRHADAEAHGLVERAEAVLGLPDRCDIGWDGTTLPGQGNGEPPAHQRPPSKFCVCGNPVPPGRRSFCSAACVKADFEDRQRTAARLEAGRICQNEKCGQPIPMARKAGSMYCSMRCQHAVLIRRYRARKAGNGHV